MTKTYQWYYNGSAIGGATGKTHTLTTGQTDSNLIECRTEVTYGTDSVAALAQYGTASAMEADASKLYWYAPDSVIESGGTISAWNDKSGNGNHLGQVASLAMPTYNAGGYVVFNGSSIIGLNTFAYADSTRNEFRNGSGSYGVFIVADADWSGQAADNEVMYVLLREGTGTNEFENNRMFVAELHNSFSPLNARALHRRRGISDDNHYVPSALSTGAYTSLTALHVLRFSITSGGNTLGEINDAAFSETTTTTTTSPTTGDGLYVGGFTDGSTTIGNGYVGNIYEVYTTADISASNMDAIHAELLAKYSI